MSDDELRRRFRALRHEDAGSAPELRDTLARPEDGCRSEPSWRRAPAFAAAAALVAIVVLVTGRGPAPTPPPFEPGQWAMPTDLLLELPGSRLLREAPSLGVPPLPPAPPAPRQSGLLRRSFT